ncbi:MAG TPA: NB-ARC domain-containing protein [Coleofasciculaceae cyanobacterium]|jgi:virulence-associated protein VapD
MMIADVSNISAVILHCQISEDNQSKNDPIVCDWNQAPENSFFYGRTSELKILRKWSIEERCRLIAVVGMGGIGKTALSLRCAKNLQHEFEFVIWRQLTNPGGLRKILIELIQMTGARQDNLADEFNSQIDALLRNLRQHRCLIVLDTSPAMFPSGNSAKNYQQEYQDYEQLLKRLGQEQHQSCLMLIAREKPREIALIEGETLPTRTLHLKGLGSEAKDIFRAKSLLDVEKWSDLVEVYRGNPLALKIVANTIKGLFGGKVATFLKQKTIIFGELNDLLDEQFESISTLEEQILYWLVINRQPISLSKLRSQMVIPVATAKLIEALESLLRNSFIERNIVADEVKFSLE